MADVPVEPALAQKPWEQELEQQSASERQEDEAGRQLPVVPLDDVLPPGGKPHSLLARHE